MGVIPLGMRTALFQLTFGAAWIDPAEDEARLAVGPRNPLGPLGPRASPRVGPSRLGPLPGALSPAVGGS